MTGTYKRILVAVDGSEQAEEAIREAVGVVKRNGAQLFVLNVKDTTQFAGEPYAVEAVLDILNENAEAVREGAERLLPADIKYQLYTESGRPKARIVAFAQEHAIDLIVIGATGKGTFERVLIGSTTAYVVNNAPCTVMVVRG